MAATAVVQTRIDPAIRDRAAEVLDGMGMTVSDAVRILLTRVAKEGALPAGLTVNAAEHDAWFRGEVEKALREASDPNVKWVAHEEVAADWRRRRAELVKRAGKRPA